MHIQRSNSASVTDKKYYPGLMVAQFSLTQSHTKCSEWTIYPICGLYISRKSSFANIIYHQPLIVALDSSFCFELTSEVDSLYVCSYVNLYKIP